MLEIFHNGWPHSAPTDPFEYKFICSMYSHAICICPAIDWSLASSRLGILNNGYSICDVIVPFPTLLSKDSFLYCGNYPIDTIAILPRALNKAPSALQQSNTPANVNIPYKGQQMTQFFTVERRYAFCMSVKFVFCPQTDHKIEGGQHSLTVIGHRGSGKNRIIISGEPPNARPSVMENTIKSLVMAAENGVDFVEFDVQVTKDGHGVIFHDDYIIIDDEGTHNARRIGELTLEEFLSLGFQADGLEIQRPLVRKAMDDSICRWVVSVEDRLCTLKDAFKNIPHSVGFNIELKFDDAIDVPEEDLQRVIFTVIKEVQMYGDGRKVFFSSFHPDAVDFLRKIQTDYPVLFLTEGGTHVFKDDRRNSIENAVEVCLKSGLQGIVSEVKAILQNPGLVSKVKDAGLCLLTYGELNNYVEALQKQEQVGVDGVIVDHVLEMVTAVRNATLSTATSTSDNISSRDIALILKAAA
eukprot:Gb_23010 [translate_table: standard]